ncbi:hypothetical protein Tco_0790936 [Tanacetum coccineum]
MGFIYGVKTTWKDRLDKKIERTFQVKIDDPNITIEEYIRLEEEKACRRGKVYNWETVMYGKIWNDEDVHDLRYVETEFPAIVLNDALTSESALSCEPTVSPLNDNLIDFRISFDESDDEDYTVIYDKNSFSYKIIYVDDLKTDSENDNDKVNMPLFPSPEPTVSYFNDLDFFKDFDNKFPAIVYNDALTSKLDFLTEPAVSPQHIDEFDLKDETSLFECDKEEQNVLYFNDLFPFNVIYLDDLKSDKDNDDDKIDIKQSSGGPCYKEIDDMVYSEKDAQKKNDVKARSMLPMALPNEYLITFNHYKDAKTLFSAIQIRFGGNEATKKTLLKQMYENFSATSTESLNSIFNRLWKIISQLTILGENISQEDLNLKFLRSLPSEWNTHVVVWRNKPDLDTMSFDDLYNNFKIVEQEVKGTTSSSSSLSSQNMAFVSSPSSTNEVNTAYGVSTANTQVSPASTQVSTASTQVSTANLSDDTVYAFLASQPNGSQLVHEDLKQIHEDDLEEMDLKWQLALLSMRTRRWDTLQGNAEDLGTKIAETGIKTALEDVNVEEIYPKRWWLLMELVLTGAIWQMMKSLQTWILWLFQTLSLDKLIGSQIADKSRKGVGFISYNAVPPPPTGLFSPLKFDLSNSDLEEFQQLEFEGYGPKPSKSFSEDTSNEFRESPDAPLIEELVSDDKLEKKSVFPTVAKIGFVRPKQQEKPVRKPVKYAEMYRLTAITMKGKGWNLGIIIQG